MVLLNPSSYHLIIHYDKNLDTGPSHAVSFSSDDQHLAVGSSRYSVMLISSTTWTREAESKRHNGKITALSFSPSSRAVVSASSDFTACVWSVPTLTKLSLLTGHTLDIQCVQFISDNAIVTGSLDATIRVWDSAGKFHSKLHRGSGWVRFMALSPSGALLAAAVDPGFLKVLDVTSLRCIKTFKLAADVTSMAFIGEDTLMASLWGKGVVCINTSQDQCLATQCYPKWAVGLAVAHSITEPPTFLPPLAL